MVDENNLFVWRGGGGTCLKIVRRSCRSRSVKKNLLVDSEEDRSVRGSKEFQTVVGRDRGNEFVFRKKFVSCML